MQRLELAKDISAGLRRGHPWIFQRALRPARRPVRAGQLVEVSLAGHVLGVGFCDPDAPISVRMLGLGADAAGAVANGEELRWDWLRERIERALAVRRGEPSLAGTDAMRLLHGENDYVPGLVLDRYADAGAMQFDGAGARALWQPFAGAIAEAAGVVLGRAHALIDEHGARFEVDLQRGQKTGFFLDQRDNRLRVGRLAAGASVLNLFAYTGGFSIHAALSGARQVTSVDQAAPAMAALAHNLTLNQVSADQHELVTADAFEFLAGAARRGRQWEVVVCDPPSFAPSERARPAALRAYRRINGLAMAVTAPGGTLVSCSCSSHVSGADLMDVVAQCAAQVGRRARVTSVAGAGADHPVAVGFPEGRYLDALFVAVE